MVGLERCEDGLDVLICLFAGQAAVIRAQNEVERHALLAAGHTWAAVNIEQRHILEKALRAVADTLFERAVTRDIAVVCDAAVPVGELTECIRKAEKNVLRGVKLFDVYTGVGIPEGKKSVAFSLTLRSDDGTLTDDHAEEAVRAVLDALRESFGAVIR